MSKLIGPNDRVSNVFKTVALAKLEELVSTKAGRAADVVRTAGETPCQPTEARRRFRVALEAFETGNKEEIVIQKGVPSSKRALTPDLIVQDQTSPSDGRLVAKKGALIG